MVVFAGRFLLTGWKYGLVTFTLVLLLDLDLTPPELTASLFTACLYIHAIYCERWMSARCDIPSPSFTGPDSLTGSCSRCFPLTKVLTRNFLGTTQLLCKQSNRSSQLRMLYFMRALSHTKVSAVIDIIIIWCSEDGEGVAPHGLRAVRVVPKRIAHAILRRRVSIASFCE